MGRSFGRPSPGHLFVQSGEAKAKNYSDFSGLSKSPRSFQTVQSLFLLPF